MTEIHLLYETVAKRFDSDRSKGLVEKFYLTEVLSRLNAGAKVLDLGCGSAEPIARYFIDAGCQVTGVDTAPSMLLMCRERFPSMSWLECDMRALNLAECFDAILAWDSFFHLPQHDQRRMFPVFAQHAALGALLLFTSGTGEGVTIGDMYGHPLFHASLDADEYESLLRAHGFEVLLHRVEDPDCGNHTVWLAQQHK